MIAAPLVRPTLLSGAVGNGRVGVAAAALSAPRGIQAIENCAQGAERANSDNLSPSATLLSPVAIPGLVSAHSAVPRQLHRPFFLCRNISLTIEQDCRSLRSF